MKHINLLLLSILISALLVSCNHKTASEEPKQDTLFVVNVPTVEKFVVVSVDGTDIYKEASTDSPRRVMWMENIESDVADFQVQWSDKKVPNGYLSDLNPAFTGEVLAVLGEEGDYWRVNVSAPYADISEGYVLKKNTREVTPKPITPEVAEKEDWACVYVVRDGRFKNLVFRSAGADGPEAETLSVGLLKDGFVAYPDAWERNIDRNDRLQGLEFVTPDTPNNWADFLLLYPGTLAYVDSDGSEWGFNTRSLTENQIDSVMTSIGQPEYDFVRCQYYFPKLESKFQSVYIRTKAQ